MLFGVQLPATSIIGSPADWHFILTYVPCCHDVFGASETVYNTPWAYGDAQFTIAFGETLPGFQAREESLIPQAYVPWFAFAYNSSTLNGDDYVPDDDGHFYIRSNPGYEGVASSGLYPVPEPATLILVCAGMGAVLARIRRK